MRGRGENVGDGVGTDRRKLRTYAAYCLPANRTDTLVVAVNGIEELQSVTELMTPMRQ